MDPAAVDEKAATEVGKRSLTVDVAPVELRLPPSLPQSEGVPPPPPHAPPPHLEPPVLALQQRLPPVRLREDETLQRVVVVVAVLVG